jgi:hypothetical protein
MSDSDNVQSKQSVPQQSLERTVDAKSIQESLQAFITNPVVQQVAGDVASMARDVTVGVVSAVVTNKIVNSNNSPAQNKPPLQTPPPANTSGDSQEGTGTR